MASKTITVKARLDGSIDAVLVPMSCEVHVVVKRPLLHVLEVAQFSFFEDREVLLPDVEVLPADVPGPDRTAGIEVAAAALRFLDAHPNKRLLVVGHTDTVGSKKDNKQLSVDRAMNVQMYLSGDIDGWAAHCQKHHEVEDVQSILSWISGTFADIDCDPGPIDGELGPLTWAALQTFRDTYAERAGIDPWSGRKVRVDDWRGFAHLYDEALAVRLGGAKRLRELREWAPFTSPSFVGLGEKYPTENPTRDAFESERNRRVDLVFLDPDEHRFIVDEASIEDYLYARESVARREWLPIGFPARSDELVVKVQTEDGQPVSGVDCTLTLSTGEVLRALLDASGFARFFGIPHMAATFRLPSIEAIDWGAEIDGQRPLPPVPEEADEQPDEEDSDPPMITPAMRACLDLGDREGDDIDSDGDDGDGDGDEG